MRKYLTTGLFGAILGLAVGAPADAALVSRGFLDEALENYATTTALDLKANQSDFTDLSDKIGTLPEGAIDIGGTGLSEMFGKEKSFPVTIPSDYTLSDAFQNLFYSEGVFPSFVDIAEYTMYGGTLSSYWESFHGIKTYKGLLELTKDIGTLPSGNFSEFPESEKFFSWLKQPFTYPTSLAELINAIYGDAETSRIGLLPGIIAGFSLDTDGDGITDSTIGTLPNFMLATEAKELATTANTTATAAKTAADANTAKIGDLPRPDTTVAGMMGHPVLLNREQTIIPLYDLILWGSNGQMVMNPITGVTMPFPLLGLHDITAKVNKIGELPTEYATVGAALTAIKGIAEEAKAAALAAIPDPKTEGSTGKFVLTVDIVGDNTTYRWEKIDREGETTTTTE